MIKVAVIDDNPLVTRALEATIDWPALGCAVVGTADNGEDAEALICERGIDIIISDVKMPGMDGLTLCERINALDVRAKIILMTGYQEFELARRAVRVGAFDLLCKPLSNDEICRVVKNAIEALKKEGSKRPPHPPSRAPLDASPLVRRAVAYLEQNFARDISLEELSEKLIVNPSYLSREILLQVGDRPAH
jgi:two-component system response regulator YesN